MVILALALIAITAVVGYAWRNGTASPKGDGQSASSTIPFNASISDGTVVASYTEGQYGLTTDASQILVKSYIPSCSDPFDYCLYYTGGKYDGTNFESAGLRIAKRADMSTERLCLNTPPSGFSADKKPTASTSTDRYSSSKFSPVGDAGAGHYASGSLFRLYYRQTHSCYEFETRIGQSQFMNYPAGSIKEFTKADQEALSAELRQMLAKVTLSSGDSGLFDF